MSKFTDIARNETTLSRVMEGRTKIKTEDIIDGHFVGVVTITEFDFVQLENKNTKQMQETVVLSCKEYPDSFFFGGAILTRIASKWCDAYEGDIDGASAELTREGGVRVKLAHGKTRQGNNVTTVTVLD